MKQTDRFEASQSNEGRYRMLVEAITDYAIYMLDPDGHRHELESRRQRFKGYRPNRKSSGSISPAFTPRRTGPVGLAAARAGDRRSARANSRTKAGASARTARRFWAYVVIDPIRAADGELVGFAKITRDLTERRKARSRAARKARSSSACWCRASPTTPSTCSTPKASVSSWNAGAQRIKGYSPKKSSASISRDSILRRTEQAGVPQTALETAAREGRFEKEGWRVRKDGTHILGERRHRCDPRSATAGCIGFAKITRDITERDASRASAGEDARGAASVAEDGGDRPADRRHRPRLQQSADGDLRAASN